MPIYEYFCPDNNRVYQFFAKSIAQGETTPKCPDDPAFRMVRMVSAFSIGSRGQKSDQGPAAGAGSAGEGEGAGDNPIDDARMEAAFSQLEREMGSVDENDPRAMGRMMRRMSELTGENLDGEMEEVVRKLEEGQDPDSIEADLGGSGDPDEAGGGFGGGFSSPPSRDPKLYDY